MIQEQILEKVNGMKSGVFRLRGRELYSQFGVEPDGAPVSIYRVSKDGDVNYSTIFRWINDAESVDSVKSDILFGYLSGLGLSIEDILTMKVSDLFEYVPEDGDAA